MSVTILFTRSLALGAAVVAFSAPSLASPASDLRAVENHLGQTQSLVSTFVQTDGKGRSLSGTLTLKRPGRIRFEYGRGANMLLVGNGKTLSFIDYEVGQKSSCGGQVAARSAAFDQPRTWPHCAHHSVEGPGSSLCAHAMPPTRFGTLVLAFTRNPAAPRDLSSKAGRRSMRRTRPPRSASTASAITSPSPKAPLRTPNRSENADSSSLIATC